MRDFKFRAFNKTTKEMYWNVFLDTGFYNHQYESNGVNMKDLEIMQYSGLKDKNGKEIYEGDIFICDDNNYPESVIFLNGCFVSDFNKIEISNAIQYKNIKVIGNIYEHPELLKGE